MSAVSRVFSQKKPLLRPHNWRIDTVVVYKIRPLTGARRFCQVVEMLDRQGASFVSVTQRSNTRPRWGAEP